MKFNIQHSPFKIILILVAALAVTLFCSCSSSKQSVTGSMISADTAYTQSQDTASLQLSCRDRAVNTGSLELSDIRIEFFPPFTLNPYPFTLAVPPPPGPQHPTTKDQRPTEKH